MQTDMLILLFCSSSEPRRIKAVFNVLIGKRTVSNLFWGFNYGLLDYLDSFHGLSLDDLNKSINDLKQRGLIIEPENNFIQLTELGDQARDDLLQTVGQVDILKTAGQYDVELFKKRIILATQVVSEYSYQNNRYYPQSIDMLNDSLVKLWFIKNKATDLIELMRDGWIKVLSTMSKELADFYAQTLIGHERFGQTPKQIANKVSMSESEVRLWLYMGDCLAVKGFIDLKNSSMDLLFRGVKRDRISHSALVTWDMFSRSNSSLIAIADKRRVKVTTIREHLLECAILLPDPQPLFDRVLNKSLINKLDEFAPDSILEWKFDKSLSQKLQIDFFEFRMYQIMRSRENAS
ncbi:helix-turn-helix domain-containing protein [Lentilactobacillus sp. SPB1-3]|uniref:Helix-turn-helix domain-containing protein n=1 Tax=Lentilactobacillus terminaliae TaxID=3003483 RepID=A0ACD5DCM5_9LACO|nr:helix-turn-helix domain-containing protein [Lentilactobacillus sp. SPB1-3]MCZ0977255.1 helix-turn-helix domain-containing protein [Lentilactobacillus sp. SPB1-3]